VGLRGRLQGTLRVGQDFLSNGQQLLVGRDLLGFSLSSGHALKLLHPAARRALAIGKTGNIFGNQIAQPADQASQNADGVPEQGRIGRPVNIGFYNRRIHAQLLPIFQAVIDGRSNDGVIKLLHRRGRQPVECMIESVVPGNRRTLEARKFPQRVSIINTFPKLPVIPILDAHQNQRTQNLARR